MINKRLEEYLMQIKSLLKDIEPGYRVVEMGVHSLAFIPDYIAFIILKTQQRLIQDVLHKLSKSNIQLQNTTCELLIKSLDIKATRVSGVINQEELIGYNDSINATIDEVIKISKKYDDKEELGKALKGLANKTTPVVSLLATAGDLVASNNLERLRNNI